MKILTVLIIFLGINLNSFGIEIECIPPEVEIADGICGDTTDKGLLNGVKDKKNAKKECGEACKLNRPMYRAVGSTVLGLMSTTVASVAAKEIKIIEQNILDLEAVRDRLVNAPSTGLSGCSQNDFDDESKPACYCFNSDNSLNRDRDPGGVCASFYPNYRKRELNVARNEIRGCVTQSGHFDLKCQCKSKKSGPRSCHKTTSLSFPGLGKSTRSLLASPFLAANKLNSGNIQGAAAYTSGDGRNIARLAKKIKDKKLGKKKSDDLDKVAQLELRRISKNPYFKKLRESMSKRGSGGSMLSALPLELRKKIEKNTPDSVAIGDNAYSKSGSRVKSRARRRNDEFKIGKSEEFAIDGLEEEMLDDKKYDYKDSDISKVSGASIFKVISSRYHRSAYRRLFKETK